MFHTSDETQEAMFENKPGAHAMHRLHNLIHHAEHTAAMPGVRETYVRVARLAARSAARRSSTSRA